MILSNADIRTYCKLGYNVSAADIYIEEAEAEFEQKINSNLFARFEVVDTYIAWAVGTAYTANTSYVTYGGKLWKCLVSHTGSTPATGNANWDEQDIYPGFIIAKQHLAYAAFSKMLVEHGIEVQGSGLVKYSGADSQTAISPQERAAMVNRYKNKADSFLGKFMKWIDDLDYEVDGVEYPFTDDDIITHTDNFGIF